jgi:hypothetical protein
MEGHKDRLVQHAPDRVPPFNASETTLLIVLLTDLNQLETTNLAQQCQVLAPDNSVQTWYPSKSLLRSIARQGPHRDSKANLHALAIILYNAGWTVFVAADEQTKRQLTNTCYLHLGESTVLFIVEITMWSEDTFKPRSKDEVRVIARRNYVCPDEDLAPRRELPSNDFDALERYLDHDPPDDYLLLTNECRFMPNPIPREHKLLVHGMVLHDPGRRVFTKDNPRSLAKFEHTRAVESALSTRGLPLELVTDIMSAADDQERQVVYKELWTRTQTSNHMHIFLLFPTTNAETSQIHQLIKKAIDQYLLETNQTSRGMTIELIPQDRHLIKSRLDLIPFLQVYRLQRPEYQREIPFFHFLCGPIKEESMDSAEFGLIFCDPDGTAAIARDPFHRMIDRQCEKIVDGYGEIARLGKTQDVEILHDLDSPFYYLFPPWDTRIAEAALDEERMQDDEEIEIGLDYFMVVLYLTNKLTPEQDQAIRADLTAVGEDDDEDYPLQKACVYIPWTSDRDGTVDDIWDLLLRISMYENTTGVPTRIFCIDQQSALDQHGLMVETELYECEFSRDDYSAKLEKSNALLEHLVLPSIEGFSAKRTRMRDAHNFLDCLQRNLTFVSSGNSPNLIRYQRPGWPAPGVLPL